MVQAIWFTGLQHCQENNWSQQQEVDVCDLYVRVILWNRCNQMHLKVEMGEKFCPLLHQREFPLFATIH